MAITTPGSELVGAPEPEMIFDEQSAAGLLPHGMDLATGLSLGDLSVGRVVDIWQAHYAPGEVPDEVGALISTRQFSGTIAMLQEGSRAVGVRTEDGPVTIVFAGRHNERNGDPLSPYPRSRPHIFRVAITSFFEQGTYNLAREKS